MTYACFVDEKFSALDIGCTHFGRVPITSGVSVRGRLPERMEIFGRHCRSAPDFFNVGVVRFMSTRARELLDSFSVNAEYYEVANGSGNSVFLFVALSIVEAIDDSRCIKSVNNFGVPFVQEFAFKAVVDEPPLYINDSSTTTLLMRDDLVEAIRRAGMSGLWFLRSLDRRKTYLEY